MIQKKLDANRAASEDVKVVEEYYKKLLDVITKHGLVANDIWNMDETGFRIGVGKDQLIITKRKRAHYFSMPENRESATAVEAISASGEVCPTFLILSGQQIMSHYVSQANQDPRAAIAMTPTGYTNYELAMEWINHFNKHTRPKTVGAKRLLILDGHGSHHTREFIQYCEDNDIIPFGMPPHMTHLFQPLDVVVFQPLKHYYAKELDALVRDGLTNITKVEFLSIIEGVRKQAFKQSTIISAFKKTGISPYNPVPILQNTPVTIRQVNRVAWRIEKALYESPDADQSFVDDVQRLVRGCQSNTAELIQVNTTYDIEGTSVCRATATTENRLAAKPTTRKVSRAGTL